MAVSEIATSEGESSDPSLHLVSLLRASQEVITANLLVFFVVVCHSLFGCYVLPTYPWNSTGGYKLAL